MKYSSAPRDRSLANPFSKHVSKGTILVVDDEPIIRRMVQNILQHFDYRVLSAENGQDAIDLLSALDEPVDVMILDVSMPVMNGHTALVHIRKIRPDLKAIVSSGLDEANVEERFADLRVTGFIRKPYSVQTLVDAVEAARTGHMAAGSGA